MYQLEKIPFIKLMFNILKLNLPIYDVFCADESKITFRLIYKTLLKNLKLLMGR